MTHRSFSNSTSMITEGTKKCSVFKGVQVRDKNISIPFLWHKRLFKYSNTNITLALPHIYNGYSEYLMPD